jgi:hypothetical protein
VPRHFLTILLFLGLGVFLASPAVAKSKAKSQLRHHAPTHVSLKYDRRMQVATKIANSNARRHSRRHCWRAVKNALVRAKVVSSRPSTRYAKQAGNELQRKYSFKKLNVKDPRKAPLGAILVYGGRGAGHVEIRTTKGFVSDFTHSRPSRRPLIGVYVSPKMVSSNRSKATARRS